MTNGIMQHSEQHCERGCACGIPLERNQVEKIDFVILWVDGGDAEWLKEKEQYSPKKKDYSSQDNRFRDWNNLKYWFRGVEAFAPWVNRIFFITWGHLPPWLNAEHPKLRIVNHKDFIPAEYLPTFNSNTIELNLHRIEELSEQFVLFNDDTFLIKKTSPEDFFSKGMPRDEFVLNALIPNGERFKITQTSFNNISIINKYFPKKSVVKKMPLKILNWRYGTNLGKTILSMPWKGFTGIRNPHVAASHLKSTFHLLWEKEFDALHETCKNKFRGNNDVNHWLMRYWNLCSGHFIPRQSSFGSFFAVSSNNAKITDCIKKQKNAVICINDMSIDFDFEKAAAEINAAFETILSERSAFEAF